MPGGQNEKPTIGSQQMQAIILMAIRPSDPAISRRAFPGGGRKAEQGHPFGLPGGHIPDGFANLGERAQIMMRLHELVKPWKFRRAEWDEHGGRAGSRLRVSGGYSKSGYSSKTTKKSRYDHISLKGLELFSRTN